MPDVSALFLDSDDTWEEGLTATVRSGRVVLSVAEEQAVDSYNQTFECKATLALEQAIELRDWLTARIGELSR